MTTSLAVIGFFSRFRIASNSLGVCLRGVVQEPSIKPLSLSLRLGRKREWKFTRAPGRELATQTGPCVQPAGKHGCH